MWNTILGLILFFVAPAYAQGPFYKLPCEQSSSVAKPDLSDDASAAAVDSYIECLEDRQAELVEALNMVSSANAILAERVEALEAETTKQFDGPLKVIETEASVTLAVINVHRRNRPVTRTDCVEPLQPKPGFTLVGAALSRKPGELLVYGCNGVNVGNCSSPAMRCEALSRSEGCYVNNEWLEWYSEVQSRKGLVPSYNEICRE